jgi:hypothetical protein
MPFVKSVIFFQGNPIIPILRRQIEQMREIVGNAGTELLNTAQQQYVENLVERFKLQIPVLDMEGATKDVSEGLVPEFRLPQMQSRYGGRMIPGTICNLEIPYTGHKSFFDVAPTVVSSSHPQGFERDGKIVVTIAGGESLTAEEITKWFTSQPALFEQYLEYLRVDERQFAPQFVQAANEAFAQRVAKLKRDAALSAAIPFPLKARPDAPMTYAVPTVQRRILPTPAAKAIKGTPVLMEDHYKHILSVIDQMTKVMERSPRAFKEMGEEDIRTHYLVQLNGHYEANATGETFNLEGKTDISIRDAGEVIFIAELKFWDGPKSISDAIDQLLKYVSWRDTKTALVVFNRRRDFTKVVASAVETVRAHPNCRQGMKEEGPTRFRFTFKNKSDDDRDFAMTLMLFNVPT